MTDGIEVDESVRDIAEKENITESVSRICITLGVNSFSNPSICFPKINFYRIFKKNSIKNNPS